MLSDLSPLTLRRAALLSWAGLAGLAAPWGAQAAGPVHPAPAAAAAGPSGTELLCALRTGDATATVRAAPVSDPLSAQRVNLSDRFVFRALALASPVADQDPTQPAKAEQLVPGRQVAQVVVTVLDTESEDDPQPLAQVRWLDGLPPALAPGEAWQPRLSGWQRVYSPHLGRELVWGCAVAPAGSTPAGWAEVSATASAAGLARVTLPPPRTKAVASARKPMAAVARPQPGDSPLQLDAAASPSVRLAWLGDVMLDDGPGRVIAGGGDPFAAVASLLQDADLRIANLECVVASGGKAIDKPWTFRAAPRVLPVLQRHVDVVSLANNHSGDYGPQAFTEMLDRLEQAGLPYFGGGRNLRQAHQPRVIERQGLRIALLGYDEMFPRRFEAGDNSPGVAWSDEEQVVADIAAARQVADVVIPYMHWGQEHSPEAHARQRALARRMIAAGADAVVGTHPHVRQLPELVDGKPVVYSLGNFVFDGFEDADNNTGSILWMTLDRSGVRDWHLQTVRIDEQGRPRPLTSAAN